MPWVCTICDGFVHGTALRSMPRRQRRDRNNSLTNRARGSRPSDLFCKEAAAGPTQPTWALQQVGSYLRYTGRDAQEVARAALDPERTSVDQPASDFTVPTSMSK